MKVYWEGSPWVYPGIWYVMFTVITAEGNNHSHFHLVRNTAELRTAIEVLSVFVDVVKAEVGD